MDGTDKLCLAVYNREPISSDYIGWFNARMLHDATKLIYDLLAERDALRAKVRDLEQEVQYRKDLFTIHARDAFKEYEQFKERIVSLEHDLHLAEQASANAH
jgi:hypothetical protein